MNWAPIYLSAPGAIGEIGVRSKVIQRPGLLLTLTTFHHEGAPSVSSNYVNACIWTLMDMLQGLHKRLS